MRARPGSALSCVLPLAKLVHLSHSSCWTMDGPLRLLVLSCGSPSPVAGSCNVTGEQQRLQYHETRMLAALGRSLMADGDRVSALDSIFFNLPNIHFIPCPVVTSKVCGRSKCLPS